MSSSLLRPESRVLATLNADGSRRWLYPRLATGPLWQARRVVGWGLIGVFNVLPFLSIGGKPVVLLDVMRREFTLVGYTFLPRDTFLLALLAVSAILAVFLFTSVAGRVWCGWGCPQTVYLEFVYRPVERLFLGRAGVGGKPAARQAAWRYGLMYAAYLLFSAHIANTFLAYFVGVNQLSVWTAHSPLYHPAGFAIVAAVTGAMMFNFAFFREQTCTIACPYGRFQSVLLDRNSLVVRYDGGRGEPRGRRVASGELRVARTGAGVALPVLTAPESLLATRNSQLATPTKGDCVDCTMCVQVCPTGIDIREGTQLECVNCAQCIDACDAVMTKVGRPTGLIRYASEVGLAGGTTRVVRPRTVIYSGVLVALLSALAFLLATKSPADVLLVRNQGLPYVMTPDGRVENTMRLQLTNRTTGVQRLGLSLAGDAGGVTLVEGGEVVTLKAGETVQKPIHLVSAGGAVPGGKRAVTVRVTVEDGGKQIERTLQFFGPPG